MFSIRTIRGAAHSFCLISCIAISSCGATHTDQPAETPLAPVAASSDQPVDPPNIVLIVADDLGFSDLGVLGSEISTPNIDALAKDGALFTRFYTSPTCSPTRAMLLSGVDNHLAGLGNMAETIDPAQKGQPGYEGHLNLRVASLAEIFKDAGYQTYMTGKWHLGTEFDQSAHARGFEKTFNLIGAAGSHFADRIGQDQVRNVSYYRENGELLDSLPADFFSTNTYTERLIDFIEEGDAGTPFLAYLAYTAPHWPLQAPKSDIDAQLGNYSVGYDVVRERRFNALKHSGIISADAAKPASTAPAWETLTAEQKARSERTMEVYAAMVANMDRNIGELIQALRARGDLDNTIIVFLSDNGADGLEFDAIAPVFAEWTNSFDNSLENIGHIGSYVSYGSGWAHAGEAPHTGFKGHLNEGGTRSPLIVALPDRLQSNSGLAGTRYDQLVSVRDLLPTLLDYASIDDHGTTFAGRDVHPISGTSIRPLLEGTQAEIHSDKAIGSELWNLRSIVRNEWKLVVHPEPIGDGVWRLYDVVNDQGETNDLSKQHPEIVEQLLEEYASYAEANNVIESIEPRRLRAPEHRVPIK